MLTYLPFSFSSSWKLSKPGFTSSIAFFFFFSSKRTSYSLLPSSFHLLSSNPKHAMSLRSITETNLALHRLSLIPPYHHHLSQHQTEMKQCAGVLVTLMTCPQLGLCTLLTVRAHHLRSHAGEVSFPGGKYETTDTSLYETALREAREEIKMPTEQLQFITSLAPLRSLAGIWVHPYLFQVPGPNSVETLLAQLTPNEDEVSDIFVSPLPLFLSPAHHRSFEVHGRHVHVFEMEWKQKIYEVWGLTAILCIQLNASYLNKKK
ncbi:hypothetical protein HMI55_006797 [Coelomomyces lativittatus]|nr:hypothetical protein HMI55_006797 [Coelomomyces lativittatus]